MTNCRACGAELPAGAEACGVCQVPVMSAPKPASEFDSQEPSIEVPEPTPHPTVKRPAVEKPAPPPQESPAEAPAVPAPVGSGAAHNCLVCAAELKPEDVACSSCGTPAPNYAKPMMESVVMEGTTGTSRLALWAIGLVGLGFCIPFAPFAAVPVGMAAMREIEDSGNHLAGRGMATVGMIAGGLFGALQLFLVLAIVAPAMFGGVSLLAGMAGSGEDVGMGAIKQLYEAEAIARFSTTVDEDGDGLGEFTSIARLGEGPMPYLRKDFADGSVGGYWLQVVLPEGTDNRELDWWGIAQPQSARRGWRTFVVDARGVIHAKDTQGAQPDLSDLESWEAVDMVMSRYDVDAQAAQAEIAQRQFEQTHRQAQFEGYEPAR